MGLGKGVFTSEELSGLRQLFSKGKQMLLSPAASRRERGAAVGVFGLDVRAPIKDFVVPCQG